MYTTYLSFRNLRPHLKNLFVLFIFGISVNQCFQLSQISISFPLTPAAALALRTFEFPTAITFQKGNIALLKFQYVGDIYFLSGRYFLSLEHFAP